MKFLPYKEWCRRRRASHRQERAEARANEDPEVKMWRDHAEDQGSRMLTIGEFANEYGFSREEIQRMLDSHVIQAGSDYRNGRKVKVIIESSFERRAQKEGEAFRKSGPGSGSL